MLGVKQWPVTFGPVESPGIARMPSNLDIRMVLGTARAVIECGGTMAAGYQGLRGVEPIHHGFDEDHAVVVGRVVEDLTEVLDGLNTPAQGRRVGRNTLGNSAYAQLAMSL